MIRSLTRRGWALCGASVAFLAAGRVLGIPELFPFAVVGFGLVVGAMIYVRYTRWDIEARRDVRPPQVPAGANSRVELSVRNQHGRRSPVLSARDPFDDGRRWARFHIAPLGPGERVKAAYRLPTAERGVFPLGPLQIGLTDPFGLAIQTREAAPGAKLVVYPRVDRIAPLSQSRGADPTGSTGHPSLAAGGDDFYALRPYQTGDDLRRVHWPSSARSDEIMIRQDELPWQGQITVLADLRAPQHSPASLELALSAVASILQASSLAGRQVRLVTTDGVDSGFGSGHTQMTTILGRLAAARPGPATPMSVALSAVDRGGTTGGVAVVTTDSASDEDLAILRRLSARFGSVAVVIIERSAWDSKGGAGPTRTVRSRGAVVRVTADHAFPVAWNAMVGVGPAPGRARADLGGPAGTMGLGGKGRPIGVDGSRTWDAGAQNGPSVPIRPGRP